MRGQAVRDGLSADRRPGRRFGAGDQAILKGMSHNWYYVKSMIKPQSGRHRAGKRRITVALLVLATLAGGSPTAGHGVSPQGGLEGGGLIAHAPPAPANRLNPYPGFFHTG